MEDYQDDKELFRVFEHNLYDKEHEIAIFNNISLPSPEKFQIDFHDVEYPLTVQDSILQDEFGLKHNLITEPDILMRDNKDLSFAAAVKKIKENKELNKELRNLPPMMFQNGENGKEDEKKPENEPDVENPEEKV